MKIALSVAWLALAALFFGLAWDHAQRAAGSIPPFETSQPSFEFSGSGFHFELELEGTPLDQPFEKLEQDLGAYLTELDERVAASHRRSALGLAAAGLASLAGLALSWRTPGSAAPRRTDPV